MATILNLHSGIKGDLMRMGMSEAHANRVSSGMGAIDAQSRQEAKTACHSLARCGYYLPGVVRSAYDRDSSSYIPERRTTAIIVLFRYLQREATFLRTYASM